VSGRIVVVGDIVTDVVAIIDGPIAHASDTDAAISMTGGGAGANTAAWLAHAGADVTFCGVVGDDQAGSARLAELAAAGITCAVRTAPSASTGAIVVIAERVERTMLADRGANLLLDPKDVDAALGLGSPVHLHLSGYALLDAASRPAAEHALREARARGMTTSVDAASAGPLRRAPGFIEWVRGTDVLFANVDEAAALVSSSGTDPEALAVELSHSVGAAVVKRGGDGALAVAHGRVWTALAAPAAVVDATGAGDAFAAGFLNAWLASPNAFDLSGALSAGTAMGARAVSSVGARPVR
jgi:sugar/nucleoside kinase (ribokinase family)